MGNGENTRGDSLDKAAEALRQGLAVVFPTDTVYGLGVSVEHAGTPQAVFDIKHRAADKPIAWLVSGPEALDAYGSDVPERARRLAREHWPGALTIIVKASDKVPAAFLSGGGTVGLRMPASQLTLALIDAVGSPLATTSANISGSVEARSAEELDATLLEQVGAVLLDDSGEKGNPSTVVDCSSGEIVVLRRGDVAL